MTGIDERIAGALRKHYLWDSFDKDDQEMSRCRCDVDNPSITNGCEDGGWMPFEQHLSHVASVLVAELGLAEEAATIPVFIEDVPRKMVWRGMEEGPAMHAEFIHHARYTTPWNGPDCPDCAIEPGIHDRRHAEILAQTRTGRA